MADGSYAFKWGNGVMIYGGTGSGLGQPFTIYAGGSSHLTAVCGNDPTIHGQYFHVEGDGDSSAAIRRGGCEQLHKPDDYFRDGGD
jgi:hypothetical protein